jgi:hypothetical protein
MKKSLLILSSILLVTAVSGQSVNDALRISQKPYVASASLFSQNFYEGTARTAAMGNAFISLGGDVGAISINPAASGIYKYSEFSITPSVNAFSSSSDYLGTSVNNNIANAGVSSLGYVGSFGRYNKSKKGSNFNLSFSINKLNNFNSRFSAGGTTNQSSWLSSVAYGANGTIGNQLDMTNNKEYPFSIGVPWRSVLAYNAYLIDPLPDSDDTYFGATENLVGTSIVIGGDLDQNYTRETNGGLSEFVVNIGGGVANKFFYGVNVGIQSLNYSDRQIYSESAVNSALFNSGFDSFEHTYNQTTTGVGFNAKFGLIYLPVKGLRIGATITTPTFMTISDEWDEKIVSNFKNPTETYTKRSSLGDYNYNLITPMRVGVGASVVIGTVGILSADVEGVGYNWMKLSDNYGNSNPFDGTGGENETIRNDFRFAKNFRFGFEVKPLPQFALRGGYSFYQSPEAGSPDNHFVSVGAGILSKKGFFGDIAVIHKVKQTESLRLYADIPGSTAPIGSLENSALRLMLTFGFRF